MALIRNTITILSVLSLFLFSCQSTDKKETEGFSGQTIPIDISKAEPLMQNISNIKVVRLDLSTEKFPGDVYSGAFGKDFVALIDISKARGVYGYDFSGKQLFAYDKVGQGPEEFIGVSDVQVYNDSIFVLDSNGQNVFVIDKKGNYLTKIGCPPYSYMFARDKSGGMYFSHDNISDADNGFNLTYCHEGKTTGLAPIADELKGITIGSAHLLGNCGETVSYHVPCSPIVLECTDSTARERYKFDFGKYWPGPEVLKPGRHPYSIMQDLVNGELVHDLVFNESDNMLCLSFNISKKMFYYIQDKDSGKNILMEEEDETFEHPLGFDNSGRLVLLSRGDDPSLLFCTIEL